MKNKRKIDKIVELTIRKESKILIQTPILYSFGEMGGMDFFRTFQIRNGAGV
jgi:hypothetical protein